MISALQQLQQLLQQFYLCIYINFVFTNKRLFLYIMQNTWKGWEGKKAAVAGVAAEGTAVAGATSGVAEDGEKLLFLITISNCHLLFFI